MEAKAGERHLLEILMLLLRQEIKFLHKGEEPQGSKMQVVNKV